MAEAYSLPSLRKPEGIAQIGRDDIAVHHIFGADLTRINNLNFIEDDVIVYISGNCVIFENFNTGNKDCLLGIDEMGIGAVAVHPSKTKFAIGGKGFKPNVYIYDYPSLKVTHVLKNGTERTYASMYFNEEGDKLATVGGSPDYMLTVWSWEEERIILHSKAFGQDVFAVKFSEDDERRLTTSGTGHIRFWKMVTTFTGQKLQGSIGKFGKVELSDISAFIELPDGKVISGTESGDLLLWEGNFIKCRFVNDNGSSCHSGNVNNITLDRDSGCVISAGADGFIRWWSFSLIDSAEVDSDHSMDFGLTPINEFSLGEGCGVKHFIFKVVDGESRFVLLDTSGKLGVIRHDTSSSKVRGIPANASCEFLSYFSGGAITGLATSPMMHIAITCAVDGFVRLWDYVNRKMLCYRNFNHAACCLAWAPLSVDKACRLVAVGFEDGIVRVLNVFQRSNDDDDSYEMYKQMLFKPHNSSVTAVSFSPDGKIFCTAGSDGNIFFFDTTTLTYDNNWSPLRFVALGPKVDCKHLSWRKNGSLVCSCSDGVGRVLNTEMIKRLVGNDSTALELTTYEIKLPIVEIALTKEVKAAAPVNEARAMSPTKGESSDSTEAVADGSPAATASSPEKATALSVTYVPLHLNNIIETESGNLYAGATYGQTNTFVVIREDLTDYHEHPIGLYSTDGKAYLKCPPVTSLSLSSTKKFVLLGTKDGSVLARPEEFVETYARVSAHNEQCSGVSAVASSFDDTFLVSAGRDGLVVVHRMRPSRIIEAAEPLSKDIRAGIYDTVVEKEKPKVDVVEPKYLFKVNSHLGLENFSELPSNLCDDAEFLESIAEVALPESREAAELEAGSYSIQDAKLKSEDDARKLTAEEKKDNVRKLVRQLQREYAELMEQVKLVPEEVRIPADHLVVDDDYFDLLAREGEDMASEAHLDSEYEAAVSSTLRAKITQRLMDGVLVEDITLSGFRSKNPPIVHSIRTKNLEPSVMAALEMIRGMVREEEVAAARSRASQESLGVQIKAVHGQGSTATAGESAGADHAHVSVGVSVDASSSQYQNPNLNPTRSELRKKRKEELKRHLGSKPCEDEDDVRDVEAIEVAEKTIGSYKLKIADDYQVPEDQRVNAEKKKRQVVMLEDSIMSLKLQFNERFLALRALKKHINEDINTNHKRVMEIDNELDPSIVPSSKIPQVRNDPNEYPDDRDEVAPDELEGFKKAAQEKSFDKVIPPPNSIVTGSKTIIEESIRQKAIQDGSSAKKFSQTVTSHFQTLMDTNSSVGHSLSGEYTNENNRCPAADQLLSKYYPDDSGLDELEKNVPVLIAAKENFGQSNQISGRQHNNFLTVERQRLLLNERRRLIEKTEKNTSIFDEALDELRVERHALVASLKQAELKLLVLFQEYMQLLTFETRDNALQQKSAKCLREKSEIISGTLELQGKMEVKQDELRNWNEKAEQLLASFNQLVPSSYPFADQLMKIFKKKIKRNKHAGNGENGDDDDFEDDEDDDDDDDDDLDDEEIEDACPAGCDMVIYDKVLDLREKRLDVEEVTADVVKIVEDLKKSMDRLKTREKQIDKDAKSTESEIQQFQLQKQVALNQVDVYLPVRLSQVYAFTTSGELSGPDRPATDEVVPSATEQVDPESLSVMSRSTSSFNSSELTLIPNMTSKSHVLMNKSSLERVQQRIGELRTEIDAAKLESRRLHREKGAFSKQREAQKAKIEIWKEKVDELMSMKFGRVIDLDELEKGSDRTVEEAAQRDLVKEEREAEIELGKMSKEAFELKTRIAEATKENTELLKKVADLADRKLSLSRELNAPSGGTASSSQGMALNETSDRAELKQFSSMQIREIDALRNEITSLRRKDAPLLLSSTMPNRGVARSSSAKNQQENGMFPPIPSARHNSSR